MKSDEVFEEIRESRRRMSRECAHDPVKYVDYLKAFNEKYRAQVERYRKKCAASASDGFQTGTR